MKTTFWSLQKFALPLIANNLLQLLINQLILLLAVNQSLKNLAGITTIQSLLYALGGILGAVALAFNIEGSQALGKNQNQRFNQLIKSSLVIDGLIGLIFAGLTLIAGELFLTLVYGFKGPMLLTSTAYLAIQSPYILLTLLTFLTSNLIKIENKTSKILLIAIFSTLLEIALNLLLVRFMKMGIVGASLASTAALLTTVLCQFYLVRQKIQQALKVKANQIGLLLRKSLPLAGQELLEGVIFVIGFEALMARLGLTTLALYGLCAQALSIVKMPTYMYENALTIFGAQAFSQQKPQKIKKIVRITLISSSFFYLLLAGLISSQARFFAKLYAKSGSDFSQHFLPALLIALTCSLAFVIYENVKGILQAMNEAKFVLRQAFAVNLALFLLMLVLQILGKTSFTSLFLLYGASLLLLSLMLGHKFRQKMKGGI